MGPNREILFQALLREQRDEVAALCRRRALLRRAAEARQRPARQRPNGLRFRLARALLTLARKLDPDAVARPRPRRRTRSRAL